MRGNRFPLRVAAATNPLVHSCGSRVREVSNGTEGGRHGLFREANQAKANPPSMKLLDDFLNGLLLLCIPRTLG